VLQGKLWIVLIEAKKTAFDLDLAIPQTLAYMAAYLEPEQPLYGIVANGSSCLFIKTLDNPYGINVNFCSEFGFSFLSMV
jgi:hypothetical protein